MVSRSFVRALLIGAGAALVVLLAIFLLRGGGGSGEEAGPGARFDPAAFVRGRPKLDAPYVATDYQVVDAMLGMAGVRPGDFVVDLGSGDGRILIAAARSHGARGLGVDIDPARIRESRANARAAGVAHRVEFRRQDLFETPIGEADVLTLYLTREINLRLRPRILREMRPGTRVVSHDFDMGEWRPDQRQRIGSSTLHLWIVPARVEGRWTLTTGDGRTAALALDQSFQELSGTATLNGGSVPLTLGRIEGARIHFVADLGEGRRLYQGRVEGDRIAPVAGARPLLPVALASGWHAVRAR